MKEGRDDVSCPKTIKTNGYISFDRFGKQITNIPIYFIMYVIIMFYVVNGKLFPNEQCSKNNGKVKHFEVQNKRKKEKERKGKH